MGQTSVYLEWTPECTAGGTGPPCEGYTTEYYTIYLKNGTYGATWEQVDTVDNVAVTNYTIIGLQPETAYQFYVTESCSWCFWSLQSNVVTVETSPPPNARPSFGFVRPVAGQSFAVGGNVTIEWSLADDRDAPENLVVYLNYTGLAAGTIAGPISGRTTRLVWTIPSLPPGEGYRITGIAIDSDGGWRAAESQEFTVTAPLEPPTEPPTESFAWQIATAILTVAVAGLTAGLLLAVRVQLGEWYRKKRETRRRKTGSEGYPPPPRG